MKAEFSLLLTGLAAGLVLAAYGLGVDKTLGQSPSPIPPAPPGVEPPPPDLAEQKPPNLVPPGSPRLSQPSVHLPPTGTICDVPGQRAKGGESVKIGKITFALPAGRDYVVSPVLAEEGPRIRVCIIQVNSAIGFTSSGTEVGRTVNDPNGDAAIDSVKSSMTVER